MSKIHKHRVDYSKKMIILGFGSVGQSVLQMMFHHLNIPTSQVTIISKNEDGLAIARALGVSLQVIEIKQQNYEDMLGNQLQEGDFLLNLSVDIASVDLIKLCQRKGALYIDTCTEPWAGGYVDQKLPLGSRTNYALRHLALSLKKDGKPTAVITHGANPGLVSHFMKQALWTMALDQGLSQARPNTSAQWASLANTLGVKVIQIAEHDTQTTKEPKAQGTFINTWSVDGFLSECVQPAELGWGTHERHWPQDAHHHEFGEKCAIYLERPGASIRVRTWTPSCGPQHGFLIPHAESISIANYLTLKDKDDICYRPTVHYAYVPCPDAILSLYELFGKEWTPQHKKHIIFNEIIHGIDALGVLLLGNKKGAYWYGSELSIEEARKHVPYHNATSLQVAIGVIAGVIWAIEHPNRGVVEPEDIDDDYIMNIARPYLGKVGGVYSEWSPLQNREQLFVEKMDHSDPWQFLNIRVEY